ncbi:hypothetical protein [Luteimicrobium sp. DT211]|uniref:hypothetical protein n=1 Tax=Luteimicrobium sp. DT211 TaxID=3393412 RepID=UPI003CF9CED3
MRASVNVPVIDPSRLEAAYLEADDEWYGTPDAGLWDIAAGDGLETIDRLSEP